MFAYSSNRWVVLILASVTAVCGVRGADEKPRLLQLPALRDGVLTEVLVHEGQKVEKGAVLAKFDDRLARMEFEIGETRIKSARAQVELAQVELQDAQRRLELLKKPQRGAGSLDELRLEEFRMKRLEAEFVNRTALVRVAELDHQRAALMVDMHVIRSPRAGTIITILKRPGEGAKYLDTVFQLEPAEGR